MDLQESRTGQPSAIAKSGPAATILVPLDGSAQATGALPVAQEFAKMTGATIHIVHVSPQHLSPDKVRDKLKLATEHLSGVVLDQRSGSPALAVTQEATKWRSRFIVMCCHAGIEQPEEGAPNISREILLNTPCPIVLVPAGRGERPWSLRRMLVPHDGTPTSAGSIGPVGDLCRSAEADMTMLHVGTAAAAPPADAGALPTPRYLDQPQHEWPAWGAEFLARARAIGKPPCDVKLRTLLCTEEIGQAIVRFASQDQTDLIVLAWRMSLDPGRARTMRMVVQQAPCPTMIYPVGEHSEAG
jgi:nucleotide-binding universal stress UspA family protein